MGGKFSILGYFGATPNVDIGVGRLDQPMALTALFGFDVVTDVNQVYQYSVSVLNSDGSVLFQGPTAKLNVALGKPGVIICGFAVIPRVSGPRTIKVLVNGATEFEDRFTIRQGTPQEFAGMPGAALQ